MSNKIHTDREDIFHLGIKALIKNEEGKILLLKLNKNSIPEDGRWDIPGGRLEKGSSAEETLVREIEEETGLKEITNIKMVAATKVDYRIPITESSVGLILFAYLCDVKIGDIKLSSDHSEYKWCTPSEVYELLKTKYPEEFINKIKEINDEKI